MLEPQSRLSLITRFLAGGVAIVLFATIAAATVALGTIDTISSDLAAGGEAIASAGLKPASDGAPQTILIIGDDHTGEDATQATGTIDQGTGVPLLHADTFMLVRMDPQQGQTSILSIPRDLMVSFADNGNTYPDVKFNEAYAVGGVDEVLSMIKQYMPGVTVNHVIDFNFSSFIGVIEAIGCVYIDVDQRYFNPGNDAYLAINIDPGYQRLCGSKALAYVRYRHTDSDFVRVARQADFMRQAKEQLGVVGLLTKYNRIARAFGKAIRTDIRGSHEVYQLLDLVAYSLSQPVRHVPFQVSAVNYPCDNEDCVTSDPYLIGQSIDSFLYQDPKAAAPPSTPHHGHHKALTAASEAALDLYPLSSGVLTDALVMSTDVPFPVAVPNVQTGTAIPMDFHPYTVSDEQGHVRHGYRIDWSVNGDGGYYGIEGMNWTDPPLFANPTGTATIDGRDYVFVDNGASYQYIGWHVGKILYWVSNTLLDNLTNQQMLALAESAQVAH